MNRVGFGMIVHENKRGLSDCVKNRLEVTDDMVFQMYGPVIFGAGGTVFCERGRLQAEELTINAGN